jgi:putative peptide zinc metalloprotease protein
MSSPAQENLAVREAEGLRPKLRADLRFTVQEHSARRVCVIEDPSATRFFRIGLAEYHFLQSLDGSRTVAAVLALAARAKGGRGFSEAEALQVLHWAKENHLLHMESGRGGSERQDEAQAVQKAVSWLNPLIVRWPMGRPDRFFADAAMRLKPLLGWFGFALWLLAIFAGIAHIAPEWERFAHEASGLFARDNWIWLLLTWIGLKIFHESGHGIFCRHFGAPVREVGAIFVLFIPMGYVDATGSLGLASKWRRIVVALAGLYVELFLAALAAIVWARTESGTISTVAHNVVITGTVVTLFFNANPLMRFDGYFVLSDLVEIPNLAMRARQWILRRLGWLFSGVGPGPRRPQSQEQWFIRAYGIAAWCWQILVLAGMIAAASVALRGGGLLLAVFTAILWLWSGVGRFLKQLWQTAATRPGGIFRLIRRTTAITALAAFALFFPWRATLSDPGVIELADAVVLRADCPGFVESIHITDGAEVAAGQVLVRLQNDEIAAQLEEARLRLQQQDLRARLAYTREDVSTFQAERARADALQSHVAEMERYLGTLEVRAPFAGRVTAHRLEQMHGAFFKAGDEILRLGRGDRSEVKIAVAQVEEPYFRAAVGRSVQVRIGGRGEVVPGQLVRVEARAARDIEHPALTAIGGGPLALRRKDQAPAASQRDQGEDSELQYYELAEPHFIATATLATDKLFNPGEPAWVRLRRAEGIPLWDRLRRKVEQWWDRHTTTSDS